MIYAEASLSALFAGCPCRSGHGRLLQHALGTHRASWADHLDAAVRENNGSLVSASIDAVERDGCAVRAELQVAAASPGVIGRIITECAERTASFDFSGGNLVALQDAAVAEIELTVSDLSRFADWTLSSLLEHGCAPSVRHLLEEIRSVTDGEFRRITTSVFSGANTVWRYSISNPQEVFDYMGRRE